MDSKEKLGDKVIKLIQSDITQGRFKLNEKIPAEPELMKLYGVGRSTIREAIKTLATAGILKVQQGSGTFVNSSVNTETIDQRLKRADFEEINAVRKLLEIEIVTLATQHHSTNHITDIEHSLEKRKQAIMAEQRQACIDADIEFHLAIARASSNSVLADLYQSFTLIIRDFFSKREAQGISHFAMSHHLHEALFTAIKNKDVEQAQQITKNILNNNY
ncbi:FadR family transcriptional regulator [Mucilaginibacter sp. Bleaf8]|uniref:FadR/GntR family transcriptional regulator n=1 Tax=Mucilaginibacter sp. Bleaf8 TaxID=2834430 RepID=UPI001BD04F39|nr:FadR/GntR family transcriptional regulator [Mucilaginibacter sp. Bleaf8]MBS7562946.1 FadR family transcriptional regulator [Mucilaginibacter sp. Bleaf8]